MSVRVFLCVAPETITEKNEDPPSKQVAQIFKKAHGKDDIGCLLSLLHEHI